MFIRMKRVIWRIGITQQCNRALMSLIEHEIVVAAGFSSM